MRPHDSLERSNCSVLPWKLNTCRAHLFTLVLYQYNRVEGISDLLRYSKLSLAFTWSTASKWQEARTHGPLVFQQSMLEKRSGYSSCGLFIVLMRLCWVTTTPLWPGHATRRGSSRNPPPRPSFPVAGSQLRLAARFTGFRTWLGLCSYQWCPPVPHPSLSPFPSSSRLWGLESQAEKAMGSVTRSVPWARTIVERNAGQEKAASYRNDRVPLSPPAFVSLK